MVTGAVHGGEIGRLFDGLVPAEVIDAYDRLLASGGCAKDQAEAHVLGGAAAGSNGHRGSAAARGGVPGGAAVQDQILPSAVNGARLPRGPSDADPDPAVVRAASALLRLAAERGERVSQRALARRLRGEGHRFANQHLRLIAAAARPGPSQLLQHAAGDGPR